MSVVRFFLGVVGLGVFVFWVVFLFLFGVFGWVWVLFGALSMLLRVTFDVVERDVFFGADWVGSSVGVRLWISLAKAG